MSFPVRVLLPLLIFLEGVPGYPQSTFPPAQLRRLPSPSDKIFVCGDRIRELIRYACPQLRNQGYYTPPSRAETTERGGYGMGHPLTESLLKRLRRQIVKECCNQPCYERNLQKYCRVFQGGRSGGGGPEFGQGGLGLGHEEMEKRTGEEGLQPTTPTPLRHYPPSRWTEQRGLVRTRIQIPNHTTNQNDGKEKEKSGRFEIEESRRKGRRKRSLLFGEGWRDGVGSWAGHDMEMRTIPPEPEPVILPSDYNK